MVGEPLEIKVDLSRPRMVKSALIREAAESTNGEFKSHMLGKGDIFASESMKGGDTKKRTSPKKSSLFEDVQSIPFQQNE